MCAEQILSSLNTAAMGHGIILQSNVAYSKAIKSYSDQMRVNIATVRAAAHSESLHRSDYWESVLFTTLSVQRVRRNLCLL